jgi:hypothetical protein
MGKPWEKHSCLFVCYYASRRDAMYLRIILAQCYNLKKKKKNTAVRMIIIVYGSI